MQRKPLGNAVRSLQEVGEILGITDSAVEKLEKKALAKIRRAIRRDRKLMDEVMSLGLSIYPESGRD